MKKILLAASCVLITLPVFADIFEVRAFGGSIMYSTISKSECKVAECNVVGSLLIPEQVSYMGTDYTVTQIADSAFSDVQHLFYASIPRTVTSIGKSAFENCFMLAKVDLPNSISEIKDKTFKGCSQLSQITLPESVTSIGNEAFMGCTQLGKLPFSNSVTTLGNSAFQDCSNLSFMEIPASVITIGSSAFRGCPKLYCITTSNSVKSIGAYAFANCINLQSFVFSKSVESFYSSIFKGCNSLSGIVSLAVNPPTVNIDNYSCWPYEWDLRVSFDGSADYRRAKWWKDFRSIEWMWVRGASAISNVPTVSGRNGSIVVDNAPIGSTIIVEDINNETVATEVIRDATQTIPVNRKGMFIVNVDDLTYKVAL